MAVTLHGPSGSLLIDDNSLCKVRMNRYEYVKAFRQRTKAELVEAHGGVCVLCGFGVSHRALEFHHLDPLQKSFTIGRNTTVASRGRLYEESKKCILVCANCHAQIEGDEIDVSRVCSSARLERLSDKQKIGGSNPPAPTCCECDRPITGRRYQRCRECNNYRRFGISWPPDEELRTMVSESNLRQVGKYLGCSDNAVRKRLRRLN